GAGVAAIGLRGGYGCVTRPGGAPALVSPTLRGSVASPCLGHVRPPPGLVQNGPAPCGRLPGHGRKGQGRFGRARAAAGHGPDTETRPSREALVTREPAHPPGA